MSPACCRSADPPDPEPSELILGPRCWSFPALGPASLVEYQRQNRGRARGSAKDAILRHPCRDNSLLSRPCQSLSRRFRDGPDLRSVRSAT